MNGGTLQHVGVVVIGRNEGERLRRCLESVGSQAAAVVYVDSASTDSSVELAQRLGADVIQLDESKAYTAARSRNAGITHLRQIAPQIEFVQVVDGDCEVISGWMNRALTELQREPKLGVACGRRHERYPDASRYNKLADMEWNTSIGEANACGGDAMIRLKAFEQVGGYDESIIAGEEPELCLRLRTGGWKILRIDAPMTRHDAAMTRFTQWWKRSVRSGHAYAEGYALHGSAHGFNAREIKSIIAWALVLPLIALALIWLTRGASALLLLGYLVLWLRVRRHFVRHGDPHHDANLYATFCVLGKFAQLVGVAKYWWNRMLGRRTRLIEYKSASAVEAHHA